MKKFLTSLPFLLLVALAIGIGLGLVFPAGAMKVVASIQYVLGQLIMFCVPLIVIGFITPSIVRMGKNASKMLGVAVLAAYISTFLATMLSTGAGYALIPHLSIQTNIANLRELPEIPFKLDIPQIMPVMSALVLSLLLGLATVWTKSETMAKLLDEFQNIVLKIVEKVVIPILPFYIGTTFCNLSYEGLITRQLPAFIEVILIIIVAQYIWLAILYLVAAGYSRSNSLKVLKYYGPAYLTAVGTQSSAATLSVALEGAHKSPVLREDIVDFGIPLFANIHLCGSALAETFLCMTISKMLYGHIPGFGTMIVFCLLLGIFAIGAPGVPGGTVMASLGLITSVLGFDSTSAALVLAIFALQDSFGTACNITGDGALTLILTGFAKKHKIEKVSETVS